MTHSTRSRALTVAAAVLTGVAAWTLAGPVAGIRIAVNDQEVGVAQVAIVSLLAGLAAWVLFAVLDRFTSRAIPIWTVIAATVLALSLTGPLSATSTAAGITLACLHLLVGGVLIFGLRASDLTSNKCQAKDLWIVPDPEILIIRLFGILTVDNLHTGLASNNTLKL